MESFDNSVKNTQEEVVEHNNVDGDGALERCQAEVQQWKDKFIQINADMANYKRRIEKDQLQWAHMAQVRIVTKLLSIVDNFERAMVEIPAAQDDKVTAWIKGVGMIHTDFSKLLADLNIIEIPCNGPFDPELHEALMKVASADRQSGDIVAVFEKGYQMGDTILRPAKVSVAQ